MNDIKVSCITPTLNVLPKLKVAIDCYLNQTHLNKEMLILFYDHDIETKKYLLGLDKKFIVDNNIRLFHFKDTGDIFLGGLMNYLIDKAKGEYIIVWDSDDFYTENRISYQLSHILTEKSDSCTLSNVLIYSGKHKELRESHDRPWDGWEPTLMCKKDTMPLYENTSTTQDSRVLMFLHQNGHNSVLPDSGMYIYNIHMGTNISSNEHFDNLYKQSTKLEIDTSIIINQLGHE